MSKKPVIAVAMDAEQMQGVLRDLTESLSRGSKSALMVIGEGAGQDGEMGLEAGMEVVPVPTMVMTNSIYVVAFGVELEELLEGMPLKPIGFDE